jgi:hypothetical protein
MTRLLPKVQTLSAAVSAVIDSNRSDGYNPIRFVGITQDGMTRNLVEVCRKLIMNPETLEWLESGLESFPQILTLEDFVSRFGATWGFDQTVIEMATSRVQRFDQIAGGARYMSQ